MWDGHRIPLREYIIQESSNGSVWTSSCSGFRTRKQICSSQEEEVPEFQGGGVIWQTIGIMGQGVMLPTQYFGYRCRAPTLELSSNEDSGRARACRWLYCATIPGRCCRVCAQDSMPSVSGHLNLEVLPPKKLPNPGIHCIALTLASCATLYRFAVARGF